MPQASAVWSADPEQMWSFPAGFLAEFFDNHRALQLRGRPSWRSITGGSRRYVEALIAPFRDRVHLRTPVRWIHRCRAAWWSGSTTRASASTRS